MRELYIARCLLLSQAVCGLGHQLLCMSKPSSREDELTSLFLSKSVTQIGSLVRGAVYLQVGDAVQ